MHNYDINIKWDQLMSPPTLKIMDEKFIASCRAQHDLYNELPGCIRYLSMLSLGLLQHNVMLYDIDITAATNTSSIISSMEEALWLQTVTGVNCQVTFTITSI